MPFMVPLFATIGTFLGAHAPLIGALSSLGSTGLSAAGAAGAFTPSAPTSGATPAPSTAGANGAAELANRAQQALLVRQQLPGIQSQTGDSLSPDYLNVMGSQLAGVYGDSNPSTINPTGTGWLGLGGSTPGAPGLTGSLDQLSQIVQ